MERRQTNFGDIPLAFFCHSQALLSGIRIFLKTVDPGLKIAGVTNKGQQRRSGVTFIFLSFPKFFIGNPKAFAEEEEKIHRGFPLP